MHPPNSLSLLADGERSVVLEGQGLVELGRKQIDGNNADGEVIPTT
jgi:hypothetical protein